MIQSFNEKIRFQIFRVQMFMILPFYNQTQYAKFSQILYDDHEHVDSEKMKSNFLIEVFNHLVEYVFLSKPQGQGGGEFVNLSFIVIVGLVILNSETQRSGNYKRSSTLVVKNVRSTNIQVVKGQYYEHLDSKRLIFQFSHGSLQ